MNVSTIFKKSLSVGAVSCGLSTLAFSTGVNAQTAVDLELSLLVDASGSIFRSDFQTQIDAYEAVFNDSELFDNFISQGTLGQIAVNLVKFGSSANEDVPFTLIDSVTASQSFASLVGAVTKSGVGSTTSMTAAINTALNSVNTNAFDGTQVTFDISTDGAPNNRTSAAATASNALGSGVDAINALAIGPFADVSFLENSIIGGTNSGGDPAFVITANTFDEVETALTNKIRAEVGGGNGEEPEEPEEPTTKIPEPTSVLGLLTVGAFGAASKLKRNQEKA